MVFKSKIDAWIVVVIVAAVALLAITMLPGLLYSTSAAAISLVGILLGMVLPLWLLFGTYYVVEHGGPRIRSGPFRWSIRLDEIQSVEPSRAWWSSPALSLDRLRIAYGNGKHILVSPNDKAGFIEAIGQ
tara:strand:+ start:2312 stop:2701 length:390 start_codon:yes stop_codon:yes gene_type:complete